MTDRPHSCGSRERSRRARRDRKERVLHTRISDDLAEDLRKLAEDLRVPVSNIVRTVLEDAFSVVERVSDNMGDLIEEVVDEAEAARDRIRRRHWHGRRSHRRSYRTAHFEPDEGEAEDDRSSEEGRDAPVLGWQPLFLAQDRRCGECQTELARGVQAYAAVTQWGVGSATLCESCVRVKSAGG